MYGWTTTYVSRVAGIAEKEEDYGGGDGDTQIGEPAVPLRHRHVLPQSNYSIFKEKDKKKERKKEDKR